MFKLLMQRSRNAYRLWWQIVDKSELRKDKVINQNNEIRRRAERRHVIIVPRSNKNNWRKDRNEANIFL